MSLVINDLNSCESVLTFDLTQPTPLITDIISLNNYNGYDISCNGNFDGAVQLNISGSVSPYNILWNTGDNINTVSSIGAGIYSVSVTDDNGCQGESSLILSEPALLTSTIESVFDYNGYDISCFGESDGAINLDVIGGVQPYNYSWSKALNSEDINNSIVNQYAVDILDATIITKYYYS